MKMSQPEGRFDSAEAKRRIDKAETVNVLGKLNVAKCLAKEKETLYRLQKHAIPEDRLQSKDKDFVGLMKKKFDSQQNFAEQTRNADIARCFEVFLLDQMTRYALPDKSIGGFKTSDYDDIAQGVDLVAEIIPDDGSSEKMPPDDAQSTPKERLDFALDVTYSESYLHKKFATIEKTLSVGEAARLKYLPTETMPAGREYALPSFIIGLSPQNMVPLLEAWSSGNQDALDKSTFMLTVFKQIEMQALAYATFCSKRGHRKMADRYAAVHKTIEEARKQKARELNVVFQEVSLQKDTVTAGIRAGLDSFGKNTERAAAFNRAA